jgi:hypothetical protein
MEDRYRREPSRRRRMVAASRSPPPSRHGSPREERRALHQLWKAKGQEDASYITNDSSIKLSEYAQEFSVAVEERCSEVIMTVPHQEGYLDQQLLSNVVCTLS